ncbi:endolytic transglycosylase MltG [Porticoccaceae bacterium LTM1]|nr:endolytic transglycosylase MltG [Porticoccaceae bacterium LTM1]
MLPSLGRQFIIGCTLLAVLAMGVLWWVDRYLQAPLAVVEAHQFSVAPGSNLTRVVNGLVESEILDHPEVLLGYARISGQSEIKAGDYRLNSEDTPLSLLGKLSRGEVIEYQVTFPEGLTAKEWLLRLTNSEQVELGISIAAVPTLPFVDGSPEGWLYPDTYQYHSGATDVEILRRAYQVMRQVLDEEWQNRSADLPYKTPYEALIMASIIEKETGVPEERQQIAGVFVRRLQKGMRLQTDPTVIYGLGDRYSGNLTRRHLREHTAFNTYVIKGLPPTPIANPGRAAIHAALHPAEGDALYFVAKGDGSHVFSATLAEHERAVDKYQRRKNNNYRSSPSS